MDNVLKTIGEHKLNEIAAGKERQSLASLESLAKEAELPRGFAAALEKKPINIIAEIKKASPSKGLIRENFEPKALATACEAGGAACLSVLTDEKFFQGSAAYLQQAKENSSLPIIQKDFFYDVWQVVRARALGADAILLIMAALSLAQAQTLASAAKEWGLDILPEVHSEKELEQALTLDSKLIGINNRDLKTFTTALDVSERLAPLVPSDKIIICESGIHTKADIKQMQKININAFLIGESLMKQTDVKAALEKLL
jgi:indole-3-glycerol phosphate synthase